MATSKTTIKVMQTGSPARRLHTQRETLIGLGLNKIGRSRDLPDNPMTRGMIAKVQHLVRVIDAESDGKSNGKSAAKPDAKSEAKPDAKSGERS